MQPTTFLALLAGTHAETEDGSAHDASTPSRCRLRLLTVTTVEAATAVVARAAVLAGEPLDAVVDAWSARTPSPVSRAVLREQGRALLLRGGLTPLPLPRAVAIGVLAAESGIGAEDLARLVGYDDVRATLAGAHPSDHRAWTAALVADVRAMAASVAHLADPQAIPASGAPLAVLAHAH